MDEIDAALDFRNVSIVANYIKVSRNVVPNLMLFQSVFSIGVKRICRAVLSLK